MNAWFVSFYPKPSCVRVFVLLCCAIICIPLAFLILGSQKVLAFPKSCGTALEDELLLSLFAALFLRCSV